MTDDRRGRVEVSSMSRVRQEEMEDTRRPDRAVTAGEARRCGCCGKGIENLSRQAKYCSDRCRAEARRRNQSERVAGQLEAIIRAVADLQREFGLPATADRGGEDREPEGTPHG